VRDDLQELVDDVSRLLAAPVTLEDADFTLLAFCAHDAAAPGAMDAVRTRSILTRGSPPETRAWFEEFGIASAEGPLRTPADRDAGILTRLVIPVRHEGSTRGYLWLLDGGRIDPDDAADPALAAAVERAAEAGRLLADRDVPAPDLGRSMAAALTGSGPAREQAGLPEQWRLPGAGAVAAVLPGSDGPASAAVLLPLPSAGDLRPAGALSAASLASLPAGSTAGVSSVRKGLDELVAQWREACTAARVAATVPRFSPVAHWDELGSWRLVGDLPAPDPAVLPLLAEPLLAETAETFLDCAGSASRAAAALQVHRQTLYYRLARIAALTGLDLADGDDRLLLHASLRAARLRH
jgi:hypothetical protein